MVKDSSVEDDFQDVVESAAQVYISSFLKMDNPIRQTRVESQELNRQWQTITRKNGDSLSLTLHNLYIPQPNNNNKCLHLSSYLIA